MHDLGLVSRNNAKHADQACESVCVLAKHPTKNERKSTSTTSLSLITFFIYIKLTLKHS